MFQVLETFGVLDEQVGGEAFDQVVKLLTVYKNHNRSKTIQIDQVVSKELRLTKRFARSQHLLQRKKSRVVQSLQSGVLFPMQVAVSFVIAVQRFVSNGTRFSAHGQHEEQKREVDGQHLGEGTKSIRS